MKVYTFEKVTVERFHVEASDSVTARHMLSVDFHKIMPFDIKEYPVKMMDDNQTHKFTIGPK